tara:strand:+ start:427 stop:1470 length:1044 start_codon:yes stop_codon:yes gene_type:complete
MGVTKALTKVAIEGGQQFLQRMGKAKTLPKLSRIVTDDLTKHIDANKGIDAPDIEAMFKGMVNGDDASYTAFDDFASTKMVANKYQQNLGDLERAVKPQQPIQQTQPLPDNTFEMGAISEKFAPFLNKPKPKLTDKIADKEAGASYLQEAKEYWAENKTFKGFKRFKDPATGQPTHKIRDNSKFNKDGTRSAKVRKLSNREIEDANRLRTEKEQSLGATTDKTRVHHRFELSFLDRIANGLKPKEKKEFFELINNSDRWPNLKTGNQDLNMIGTKGDKRFKPIHTDIHTLLAKAGLDPDTVDFTGATMQQRLDFLDEVAPLLDQVDKFIFNQMMSAKFPDQFTAFEI